MTAAGLASAAAAASPLGLQPCSAAAGPTVLAAPPGQARLGFESRIVEFDLDNGLHFIVLPRRNAPIVSCHTYANGRRGRGKGGGGTVIGDE